ncbi:DNA-formamidopyrimidine glycosylase family protein [Massilia brevitalea]|uniref:DNA-formamidopyrimidine glycosylase family protein n=1 Tax=Massilia brevitalea TaxID=442526 RepID=UPI00273911A7
MPEGPSLYILKEQTTRFVGQTIVEAGGNVRAIDSSRLVGQTIVSLRTWGKHFLIETPGMVVRIHFLLFGTYRIDEGRDKPPRLSIRVADGGELNFYACSVREIEGELDSLYDWSADVMSDAWDPKRARKKLRAQPDMLACDALLDQDIFSGVGNIIKNEVLFRIRVHPLSTMGALPAPKLRALVEEARQYSFDFLGWKKQYVLKQHWLAHAKTICPRCDIPFKKAVLGRSKRRSFFCERCQKRYE